MDESIRVFANRPWAEIEHLKRRYWAESEMTPTELLTLADELRLYTLSVRPDWPDDTEREGDLQTHVRMTSQLFKTGHERRQ